MFSALSKETRAKRGPQQVSAVDFAIGHLNQSSSPCLIRMPTGTGKTGVIGCLTRLANAGTSLVLTPWANLRIQMIEALVTGFWKDVGLQPRGPIVIEMLPKDAERILKSSEPQVIVATFTTLNELRREREQTYAKLAKAVSLVVADEGHYEPAVEWGKSVKGLHARTVLLTAPPYRNDLKLFRITDPAKSTHHITHKDAVKQKVIRALDFGPLSSALDIPGLSAAFAQQWKSAKRNHRLPASSPRAIICCSGATDIEIAVGLLQLVGLNAIGFLVFFV